ncbi:hypothetical protein HWV62_12610 [Athelia sp. TMB]|nr:hypothetical protein HWV62_12610 [Athelia sp. TMB]
MSPLRRSSASLFDASLPFADLLADRLQAARERGAPVPSSPPQPLPLILMSSARSTPNHTLGCYDILNEIFTACSDPVADYTDTSRILSQVCRDWRQHIVASPKFWTAAFISCAGNSLHMWNRLLLQRSGSLPLTVHIHTTHITYLETIKDLLSSCVGRVRNLIVDSEMDLPPIAVWRQCQMFMSEELEFFDYRQKDGARIVTERDAIPHAFTRSHLFRHALTGDPESAHLKLSTWQLRSITSLSVDYSFGGSRIPNRDLCGILLRNIDTLQQLEIVDSAPLVGALPYPLEVTLPHLHTLIIGFKRALSLCTLLDTLRLPALRSVILRDISRAPEAHTPRHYWGCVEEGIAPEMDGGFDLLQALRAFPTITHMQVYGLRCVQPTTLFEEIALQSMVIVDSDEVFASLLCSVPGWRNLAPALTRSGRSVEDLAVAGKAPKILSELIRKRQMGSARLLNVLALSPGYLHEGFCGRIKERRVQSIIEDAKPRLTAALGAAQKAHFIPQPIYGMPYEPSQEMTEVKEDDIFEEGLWKMIPEVIPTGSADSEDETEAPWPWLAEIQEWNDDMEMEL